MTALLFSIPRQRRPLSVMRAATIRRLDWLDTLSDSTEWQDNAYVRFERLLACVEARIAPWLASRAKAQREAVKLAQDIAAERRAAEHEACERAEWNERARISQAVENDPRVKAARKACKAAERKAGQAEKRLADIELANRSDFSDWFKARTVARSQATRAYNLARKADDNLYWAEAKAKGDARKI